jgi:anti-sigma factor ChrR (cupin superfamily)
MSDSVNADFSKRVVVETAKMEWEASPSPTVWRKRLDLVGMSEQPKWLSSVVRYDAGAHFHGHPHPMGEEILVLEGVFSDEHGDYPAGMYLLNPPGFIHEPFSRDGCVLFVKLCQYTGKQRVQIHLDTNRMAWQAGGEPGVSVKRLFKDPAFPERMRLEKWAAGTHRARHTHPQGVEVFVLEGAFADENSHYAKGAWLRSPPGAEHAPFTEEGCILYIKENGFPEVLSPAAV